MGFFDWFTSKRASLENPSVSLTDPRAWEELGLMQGTVKSGVRVTPKKVLGYAPIWRGCNLIANGVAKLPLNIYSDIDGSREKAKDHAAYRLVHHRFNQVISTHVAKKTLTFHAVFYGNGYGAIIRTGRLVPEEIVLLNPMETFPIQMDGGLWYVTTVAGSRVKIPAADVLHVKGLSSDGLVGYSLLEVFKEALGVGIATREYAARFFGEGANASGLLQIPGHLKPEAMRQAMKDFSHIASGIKNSHKIGLIQDGVKWQPMSIDPTKAQMVDVQEHEIRTVANILGIPPHKLGDTTRTSYSSLEQENRSFLEESLDPWLVQWEDECNHKLLTDAQQETGSHYFEFNRAQLLQTDLITRYRAYAIGRQWGWLSANDILRKENQPAIDGGDVYLSPGNMTPVDLLGTAGVPDPSQVSDSDSKRSVMDSVVEAICERVSRMDQVEHNALIRIARGEGNFLRGMEEFYQEQRDRLHEAFIPLVRILEASRSSPALDLAGDLADAVVRSRKAGVLDLTSRVSASGLEKGLRSIVRADAQSIVREVIGDEA